MIFDLLGEQPVKPIENIYFWVKCPYCGLIQKTQKDTRHNHECVFCYETITPEMQSTTIINSCIFEYLFKEIGLPVYDIELNHINISTKTYTSVKHHYLTYYFEPIIFPTENSLFFPDIGLSEMTTFSWELVCDKLEETKKQLLRSLNTRTIKENIKYMVVEVDGSSQGKYMLIHSHNLLPVDFALLSGEEAIASFEAKSKS